jgi:hypothetical protein
LAFQSTVTAVLTAGTTYLIYASVFGFGDPPPPPPNDIIQVAIELGDLIFRRRL